MSIFKKIIIVAIIVIIIIILGIVGFLLSPYGKSVYLINYINDQTYDSEIKKVKNGYTVFSKYNGEVTSNTINKSINVFATSILPDYKSINNVQKYYNDNKDIILNLTGINNLEEFEKVVNKAKTITNFELNDYEFVDNTVETGSKGVISVLRITYKNETVEFLAYVNNKMSNEKAPIEYSATVTKEDLNSKE